MLVEMLYFTDFVKNNLALSTIFIGVARICACNFVFNLSEWILSDSLLWDWSLCRFYSIKCGWSDWRTGYHWWHRCAIYHRNRVIRWCWSDCNLCVVCQLCHLACILHERNFPQTSSHCSSKLNVTQLTSQSERTRAGRYYYGTVERENWFQILKC